MWESLGALFNLNVVDFEPFFFGLLLFFVFLFSWFVFVVVVVVVVFRGFFRLSLFASFFFPAEIYKEIFSNISCL